MQKDYHALVDLDIPLIEGCWTSRSSISGNLYIPMNREGMSVSNYYHWFARMACGSINSPSPIRSWYIKKFRVGLEKSKFYADNPATALALRKYIPAQFRPSAAKALIKHFGSTKWYDPCGGWGDRLVAAQACDIEYHCRDVNPLVFAGYAAQQQDFGGNVSFELLGAEIDCPQSNYFDLVFTSPPYFQIEKYQGDNQSYKLYKKYGEWIDGFLYPMLENAWDSLKSKGVFAINICNVYAQHRENDLTTPVIDFIRSKGSPVSYIGYRMNKRPNSKAQDSVLFAEPIIIGYKQ